MPAAKHEQDLEPHQVIQPLSKRRRTDEVIDLTNDSNEYTYKDRSGIIDLTMQDVSARAFDEEEEVDEEIRDILAQFAAQDESEKLARELQVLEEAGTSNSHASGNELGTACEESDEALARRLAAEWEEEDGIVIREDDSEESHSISNELERDTPFSVEKRAVHSDTGKDDRECPGDDLDPLFTSERPCSKCGATVPSPRSYVVLKGDGPIPPTLSFLLHAPCTACKTNHCRGCFQTVSCTVSCKGKPTKKSKSTTKTACTVHSCCAEGRAIAIFELLGGFDWKYLGEQEMSATRVQEAASRATKSSQDSVGPGGTGYSSGGYGGGYNSQRQQGAQSTATKRSESERLSEHWDEIVSRAFHILIDLLPRQYADDAEIYDMLPHSSIGNLIALSCVPEYLVSLLRNDSVSDWIKRKDVYYAMLALLRRLSECELTVQVLVKPRREQKKPHGITKLMWREEELVWKRDSEGNIEMAPPLFDYLRKLTKQCESFLASASQAQLLENGNGDASEEDTISAASLCGDIIAVRDDIVRAMGVLGISPDEGGNGMGKGKGKHADPRHAVEEEYRFTCEKLGFKHVELAAFAGGDGRLQNIYSYAAQLSESQTATRVPKDRFHLIKELATMATSLPEGIFVRVDETRNDAIKVMIAGPTSTPYAGGLFEFDIFLPMTYPNTSPLVTLRTTGGGSVRFNPNLYNNGKVCLSLLGTWSGSVDEQWKPGKSTLLQVLVSIQSMIFVEGPYFNEPGYGSVDLKKPASISYNRNVEAQTSRWAIVDWLKDEHKDGLWAEVIAAHFLIRKDEIREQLHKWTSDNPSIMSYSSSRVGTFTLTAYSNSPTGPNLGTDSSNGFQVVKSGSPNGSGPMSVSNGSHVPTHNLISTTGVINLIRGFDDGIKTIERWGLY
ncbi:hypothetical protein E1B28_008014 [Marasmius oreades]|uniref:UBC core domain-containing protein n=1 Tax=Marasmius oreades TaxID=181124 RepID=A0A9P7UUL2_9AGAR|nr:uncharacterized protein E1B28_008014 [Marasmius oreades]KAG7094415.1 hypothetical protein E1B28_008014 [Marasmius oreades]